MKVALSWIRRYVDILENPETLAHDLTMFGVNIESLKAVASPYTGVVFGKVLSCEKHPSADRLSVCKVEVGKSNPIVIVCGAANVRAGQRVPVALEGAVLSGGVRIKRSKIRGVLSEGMICSAAELGIGEDHRGIMVLDFDEKPGASLDGRLGESDWILEAEVTPNRPDLLCHQGIAREIAALYERELRSPETLSLAPYEHFKISIENPVDCPRYTAAFINEIDVRESPLWLKKLLEAVDQKPINNVVDATNFVLFEMGQPIHAFDRDKLAGDTIIVRRAKAGEKIVTLDGIERILDPDILVIADSERPVAVAGVMGSKDAEVDGETKRVLVESAFFDPKLVRRARQRLRLDTEASYRFERQADIGITLEAAARVCWLVESFEAGKAERHCCDRIQNPSKLERKTVALRISQTNRVLGTHLSGESIAALLERLGLHSRISGEYLHVSVPTFRRDILEEVDLIEEVARVYGYDNIGKDESRKSTIFSSPSPKSRCTELITQHLVSRGFAEVITSSFMDREDTVRMQWQAIDERSKPLAIANPLTDSQSVMRTSLLPGLLGVMRRNMPAEAEEIRIFEIGKVFIAPREGGGLPREDLRLTAILSRRATPLQWIEAPRENDFFDAKGELETILERFGLSDGISIAEMHSSQGRALRWSFAGREIAEAGSLARKVLESFDIEEPVHYFDLLLDAVIVSGQWPTMVPISPYPAVKRDLCIVVDERVRFARVRDLIAAEARYLESLRVFDYYKDAKLGKGKCSFTFRLSFRSKEETLESSIVDREIERILEVLNRELGAELRKE